MSTKTTTEIIINEQKKIANIGYRGKVTVSVQAGNKIISKKEYHNTGSILLFNFLCNCIKGDVMAAENLRPTTIKLFKVDTTTLSTPAVAREYLNNSYQDAGYTFTNIDPASVFVSSNKPAVVPGGDKRNTVTLHFRIPYAFITQNTINMVGLYRRNPTGDSNWSAYYLFTNGKVGNKEAWLPLDINSGQNYNLLIEWTMTINNMG